MYVPLAALDTGVFLLGLFARVNARVSLQRIPFSKSLAARIAREPLRVHVALNVTTERGTS